MATMSMPSYVKMKIQAARVEMTQNMRAIHTLAEAYMAENSETPNIRSSTYGPSTVGSSVDPYCPGGRFGNESGRYYMTNVIGFTVNECNKLRYYYRLTFDSTEKTHTIAGMSQVYSTSSWAYSYGHAPVATAFCARPSYYTGYYYDGWRFDSETELITPSSRTLYWGTYQDGDAVKNCLWNNN